MKITKTSLRYYIPISSVAHDATLTRLKLINGTNNAAYFGLLAVGDHITDRVIIFNTEQLPNLARIEFQAIDQWFEEEEPIFCHPRDPYKRIDILHSKRPVKVALDGIILAKSSSSLFLLETSLRMRYYLPPECIKWEYLEQSSTETVCPYKGVAGYYDVMLNGKRHKDLVWYYRDPVRESAPVAGYLCFYNEKVDIWVDGVKEE